MTGLIRLRKHLLPSDNAPQHWPQGIHRAPVSTVDPRDLHALLSASYANGSGTMPPLENWWPGITADSEYDPELVFIAADASGTPVGIALCWDSSFVKDFAVASRMRGRGIGQALLRAAFAAFQQRGFAHLDLKAVVGNATAIRLYHHLGMVEAPL